MGKSILKLAVSVVQLVGLVTVAAGLIMFMVLAAGTF